MSKFVNYKIELQYMDVKDKSQVETMFDGIAPKYDFLNHFLTLNIDSSWRNSAVKMLTTLPQSKYLDVASGTGDLALAIYKKKDPQSIVGIDISDGMLEYGRKKIAQKGLNEIISFKQENCENLSFEANTFEGATIGFGIRNFQNPGKGLDEIFRVLKPGGELVVLEFSRPKNRMFRAVYEFYFRTVLPGIGKLFSKHNFAYNYLPESVLQFPYGDDFLELMRKSGFEQTRYKTLTFGIAMSYKGVKPID